MSLFCLIHPNACTFSSRDILLPTLQNNLLIIFWVSSEPTGNKALKICFLQLQRRQEGDTVFVEEKGGNNEAEHIE